MDHKPGRWKKTVGKVSSPERSVTPEGTLSPSSSLQIKESNSSVTSTLTAPSKANKSTRISLTPPPVNTTAFESITLLQRQQIRPVPASTSSLALLQSRAKPDGRMPSSPS